MKLTLLMTAFVLVSSCNVTKEEWEAYKKEHTKRYNAVEDKKRMEMYKKRKRMVEEHNKGPSSYKMGINRFTDMYDSELTNLLGKQPQGPLPEGKLYRKSPGDTPPESINWVTKGAVTKVKDQMSCTGSYAFSAADALEALMFRANQTITELSVQELLDCTPYVSGCLSGWPFYCFVYVHDRHGISTAASYPYVGKEGKCNAEGKINATTCGGYLEIKSEESLKNAVGLIGPTTIIMGPGKEFFHYESGIYDDSCSDKDTHTMVAVGYDKDETTGTEYWLMKNSWSEKWGEKGYVRMIRNKNKCGLGYNATIPTIHEH